MMSTFEQIPRCIPSPFSDDSIKVFIRVRPSDPNLSSDLDTSQLLDVSSSSTIVFNSKPEQKVFTFDHVAGVATTQVRCNRAASLSAYLSVCVGGGGGIGI